MNTSVQQGKCIVDHNCSSFLFSVSWRADGRCGARYPINGIPAVCKAAEKYERKICCSGSGWCGTTRNHCTYDYRETKNGKKKILLAYSPPSITPLYATTIPISPTKWASKDVACGALCVIGTEGYNSGVIKNGTDIKSVMFIYTPFLN